MTTPQPAFTSGAHQILQRANLLSRQRNQAFITPEHILLALLQTPKNSALTVLSALGVDLERVAQRLEGQLGPQQSPAIDSSQMMVNRGGSFSPEARAILNDAIAEARDVHSAYIDERVILSGILRRPTTFACQALAEQGVTLLRARAAWSEGFIAPPTAPAETSWRTIPLSRSPVFLGLVALTAGAAILTYLGGPYARIALFVFVTGGWLVSLTLHEFGHALVAYLGGDHSVADKGYLSLNVFKYTHPLLSIIFPVLMLILGNIGLPGGAVYINHNAIRSRWMRSLMSAAGPIATGLCTLALVPPFFLRLVSGGSPDHLEFWAGMAFLIFLQLSALFFNLLPIPGLDGFGILEPFLPQALLGITYTVRRFTFIIIFLLFFNDTPVSQFFYFLMGVLILICGVPPQLIQTGFSLYRFWSGG